MLPPATLLYLTSQKKLQFSLEKSLLLAVIKLGQLNDVPLDYQLGQKSTLLSMNSSFWN